MYMLTFMFVHFFSMQVEKKEKSERTLDQPNIYF